MNKFLLLAIISFSAVLACHKSCSGGCAPNSVLCLACPSNSDSIASGRGCFCRDGYYPSYATNQLVCALPEVDESDEGSYTLSTCELAIAQSINTLDHKVFCEDGRDENNGNTVESRFTINNLASGIPDNCLSNFVLTPIYYENVSDDYENDALALKFTGDNTKYVNVAPNNVVQFNFPLIDFFNFAEEIQGNTLLNGAILQKLQVGVQVGYTRNGEVINIAVYAWVIEVYTNRNEVNVVSLDVSKKYTQGCSSGTECIIVQDLDTDAFICSSSSCVAPLAQTTFTVGQTAYIKVFFKDASYTKFLRFDKLLFKGTNIILNFTPQTTAVHYEGYTIHSLVLLEPQQGAKIQISSTIVTANPDNDRLRALQSGNTKTQAQLSLTVTESTYSLTLIFGASIALFALLF